MDAFIQEKQQQREIKDLLVRLASVEQERDDLRADLNIAKIHLEQKYKALTANTKVCDDLRAQLEREKGERERLEAKEDHITNDIDCWCCPTVMGEGENQVVAHNTPLELGKKLRDAQLDNRCLKYQVIDRGNSFAKMKARAEQAESSLAELRGQMEAK